VAGVIESDLHRGVIEAAQLLGWKAAHFRPARTAHGWRTPVEADGKGFPDLVLVRDRVVFAELKCGRNKLSPEQEAWLEALRQAGVEAYLWTDEMWGKGEIEAVLRAGLFNVPVVLDRAVSSSLSGGET